MPYKCRYCNGRFCPEHRLPESHECDGLRDLRETPRWGDYAKQVRKRDANVPQPLLQGRWDREEDARRMPFGGGPSSLFGRPRDADVDRVKTVLILLLFMVLVAAIVIRFYA
jgi:hypothetical protein